MLFALLVALAPWTGRVVAVTDGDTLRVQHGAVVERVRLRGIDAPEKQQPFGPEATAQMTQLIGTAPVTVFPTGQDFFGRTLGWVFVGKTSLSAAMVERGAAWYFKRYEPKNVRLPQLETSARANRVGLWAFPNPIPPWEWRRSWRREHSRL